MLIAGIWQDTSRRRKLFENYAKANDFDPLIPENWYLQPLKRIMAVEVNFITIINY
jgi:hypothetical protein